MSYSACEVFPMAGLNEREYVSKMDQKEHTQRCWRCDGPLSPKIATDGHTGVSVRLMVCRSCSGRCFYGDRPRAAEPPVLLICHGCRLVHSEEGGWMTKKTYRDTTGIDPITCRLKHTHCPWCYDFRMSHGHAA